MSKSKILVFIILVFLIFPVFVFAGNTGGDAPPKPNTVSLDNPLGQDVQPEALIANVINSIFGIVGSLALLMFIYGGLMWMTSGGNQEKVKQGRGVILWASIGLVVIFMSYMLVRFVITAVGT